MKTPREKDFEAGIYSGWELPVVGGTDDPVVLVSEIVTFTREYRLLVLDGQVHTGCRYLTAGRLDVRPLANDADRRDVLRFADAMLSEVADTLPSAVTVDIGWAVHADRGDEGLRCRRGKHGVVQQHLRLRTRTRPRCRDARGGP